MPKTTIEHEPWCDEHIDEAGWNSCNTETIGFGPIDPATPPYEPDHRGALWLSQDENQGNEPVVVGSYSLSNFKLSPEDARAILQAMTDDPQSLCGALNRALSHLTAEATA